MRFVPVLALASLAVVACSAETGSEAASEDDLATKAYGYTCTTSDARVLEDAARIEIAVAKGALRFVDGFGPNLGERDATYRAPKGKARARYRGFEYGGDCTLSLVVDEGATRGDAGPSLRVQCDGDDFVQDVYTCGAAKPARIAPAKAPPAPPPAAPVPAANAKKWSCETKSPTVLSKRVVMQTDAKAMRLVAEDFTYEGVRDADYRPKTGTWAKFEDFGYGGDCAMSAVVDESIARGAAAATTTLKVRCGGDGYSQDVYTCRPK